MNGSLMNSGQMCVATKRVYIHESIYEQFIDAMVGAMEEVVVGNPLSKDTTHGPVQNLAQYNRVCGFIEDCKAQGYSLRTVKAATEQLPEGLFIQSILVDNPPDASRIVAEEPFGECRQIFFLISE